MRQAGQNDTPQPRPQRQPQQRPPPLLLCLQSLPPSPCFFADRPPNVLARAVFPVPLPAPKAAPTISLRVPLPDRCSLRLGVPLRELYLSLSPAPLPVRYRSASSVASAAQKLPSSGVPPLA